ncbi:MAG: YhgE/Pip domain-containing protein [Eubacteriales bacterium]|nr:YhgE/Pip domain-containing protein [Eubacteriales bacterium]
MRNILGVFKYDIKTLSRHFFAMAVAVAICLLPSLYAWLNIYSNWDPYGNTGNISIALASMDKGYVTEKGEVVNKGQEVLDDLRESTAINWVFLDSEEEAVNGVYSGKYYAAVVIDEDFSYNMFNMLTEWTGKPSITYYENAKKNAVATKITDTAAGNVKASINEAYLEVVISTVMESANRIADDITGDDPAGSLRSILEQSIVTLNACNRMMDSFGAAVAGTNLPQVDTQRLDEIIMTINEKLPDGSTLRQTVAEVSMKINENAEKVENALRVLENATVDTSGVAAANQVIAGSAASYEEIAKLLEEMAADAPTSDTRAYIESMASVARETSGWLYKLSETEIADTAINGAVDSLKTLVKLNQSFIPCLDDISIQVESTFLSVADMLDDAKIMLNDVHQLKQAAANVKAAGADTLSILKPAGTRVASSLADALHKLETLNGEDYLKALLEILGGSPILYGEYFAQVVQTTVTPVYPIANYGSAMAPFYTVLSIWVGGVMLGAIFKAHARHDGLVDPKPHELYFGRYLLFFFLSQIQTAIIITGDLFLLKIQCLHPGLLYLCGAVTSFTFSLLIYSLAVSFGDVGKAIVVVVMVLQIAGSSGTFPIELLPEIFQKIYRFFPFPYAIDAMRECICGVYGSTYVVKLGQLLIFAVVALGIGLFARRPFIGVNEFMEERLEETEMF